ncbi:MAG: ABC transporter permease [Candidatus Rokuibacteriota bacterium]|nr:MAG: ABC transporter permease [Candidatus Rokubacteria bacterium]
MAQPLRPLARRLGQLARSAAVWQGLAGIALFLALWQIGTWLRLPMLRHVPSPLDVLVQFATVVQSRQYWLSWYVSGQRVFLGYAIGVLLGVPLGLAMGMSRIFHGVSFPLVEVLRPIPPLAWVPLSILFWPTMEQTIVSIIFLGAFFTVVLNVLGGVEAIDVSYQRAALSMGARPWHLFWRIVLPATAPSIFTGMAVGMGLTWEIVVAAEMIASIQAGLGFMMWQAYVGGNIALIIVSMASIGLAGLLSSTLIWALGRRLTPWLRRT